MIGILENKRKRGNIWGNEFFVLLTENKPQIQKIQRTPSNKNIKNLHLSHFILKLQKTEKKVFRIVCCVVWFRWETIVGRGWLGVSKLQSGLPRWLSGQRIHLKCRRHRRHGFGPWVRKIPGRGHGNPLQYSCLECPMDRGAWTEQPEVTEHTQNHRAEKRREQKVKW